MPREPKKRASNANAAPTNAAGKSSHSQASGLAWINTSVVHSKASDAPNAR